MPLFNYTAKQGAGQTVEGQIEAPDRAHALSELISQGLTPMQVEVCGNAATKSAQQKTTAEVEDTESINPNFKIPSRHLNILTRQFASLVRSGVPILRAVNILIEQAESPKVRQILQSMSEDIRQGGNLSTSMKRYPRVFSPLYVSLVRSGEAGGILDVIFEKLADKAERDEELRGKLQGAVAYPAFVGLTGFASILFLMTFVMPKLLKLFDGYGEELPLMTRALIGMTNLMAIPWVWGGLIALVIGVIGLWSVPNSPLRTAVYRFVFRLPVAGPLIIQLELGRFARSFGLLMDHGVDVLDSVANSMTVVSHPTIQEQMQVLPEHLRQGNSLAMALREIPVMTSFVVNTVAVGEESGKAGEALTEIANYYEREAERLLRVATALLEPMMVLGVGAIVGWIVMAILLPIFELGTIV